MKIKFLGTISRAKMAHPRLSVDSLTPSPENSRLSYPLSQIQHSSKQANPMSYSALIHIHLTTSINIRLTHGSRKTVENTRFQKRPGLSRKAVRKCLFGFPIKSHPIQNKFVHIHVRLNKLPLNGGDKLIKELIK